MAAIKFKALVDDSGMEKGWAYIKFPLNVSKKLGSQAMIRVRGTVNGFAIKTSAMPTGDGAHHIMFNKQMRAGAKADVGDIVLVEVERDDAAIKVVVPPDLKKSLAASPGATRTWTSITPRAKQEWIEWITSAKKQETRPRRVARAVERLESGERRVHD